MQLLGVELWCCHVNRYLIIDAIIAAVVVVVCVPIFIAVSAARVYTGVLLGVDVIFFCKLWRFLPSHQRWAARQAGAMADKLVAERRLTRPPAQQPWAPPADASTSDSGGGALRSPLYSPYMYPTASTPFVPICYDGRSGHTTWPTTSTLPSRPTSSSADGGRVPYGNNVALPPPLSLRTSASSPLPPVLCATPAYHGAAPPMQRLLLPPATAAPPPHRSALTLSWPVSPTHGGAVSRWGDAAEGPERGEVQRGSRASSVHHSRRDSPYVRGGGGTSLLSACPSHIHRRSPSPPQAELGEMPVWHTRTSTVTSHSPSPPPPLLRRSSGL
ncbi:hypothetical protein NESM_000536900 [Novymonas esmeraldas]|uniref:Uncharacterized protein n=1 Tax=Novymonas esmeraldas TaxID=1808958 RepID=A0AAW0EPF2_9TRYP